MTRRIRSPKSAVNLSLDDIRDILIDYETLVLIHETTVAGSYTTTGAVAREYVQVDNTGTGTDTISLSSDHKEGHEVTVTRLNTKALAVDDEGSRTIKGSGSAYALASQWDSATFRLINDSATDTTSFNWIITQEVVN